LGTAGGFLVAAGVINLPGLKGRQLPGLEWGAILGLVPVLAAGWAWWCLRGNGRGPVVAAVTLAAVVFVGALAAWGGSAVNAYKAPRALVRDIAAHQSEADIRIGCYQYYQPSLVFYARREVARLAAEKDALAFLETPLPVYLLLPGRVWDSLQGKVRTSHQVIGERHDLYRNCAVVVVTNRP
jgi:hypothetical protein